LTGAHEGVPCFLYYTIMGRVKQIAVVIEIWGSTWPSKILGNSVAHVKHQVLREVIKQLQVRFIEDRKEILIFNQWFKVGNPDEWPVYLTEFKEFAKAAIKANLTVKRTGFKGMTRVE